MITVLPFELLAQITEDLSQQDLLESMCSCRDWYYAFMPILYGRVILSKDPKQFRRFVEALEKAPDLRNLVHTIRWCAEVVTYANVNNIAQRCQNIGSMAITWNSRASMSPLTVSLETFPILTRLTLEYHSNSGLGPKTAEYGSTKLTAFLTSVPRLQALSLVNVIPLVRCIELNSIHKVCSDLEHLDITCVHWDAKMTDIPGIGPFPKLRTLKITYERAGSQCTRFLSDYLQTHLVPRYPNLKKVEFQRSIACVAATSSIPCPSTSLQYQRQQSQQQEKKQKQDLQNQKAKTTEQQPWLIWNDTTKRANFQGLRRALPLTNGADNVRVTRVLCSLLPRRSTYHILLSTSSLTFTGFLHTDQNMVELDILIDRFSMVDTFTFNTTSIRLSFSSSTSRTTNTGSSYKNTSKKTKGFTKPSTTTAAIYSLERLQALKCINVQMDIPVFEYINRNCPQLNQTNFSVCKSHYKQQSSNNNSSSTTASVRHVCEPVELKSVAQYRKLCGNQTKIYFLNASWTTSAFATMETT